MLAAADRDRHRQAAGLEERWVDPLGEVRAWHRRAARRRRAGLRRATTPLVDADRPGGELEHWWQSATRSCCTPSCRSSSILRRSASSASTSRLRETPQVDDRVTQPIDLPQVPRSLGPPPWPPPLAVQRWHPTLSPDRTVPPGACLPSLVSGWIQCDDWRTSSQGAERHAARASTRGPLTSGADCRDRPSALPWCLTAPR